MNRRNFGRDLICCSSFACSGPFASFAWLETIVTASKSQGGPMWGMIQKITAVGSKRNALVEILSRNSKTMPGCLSYLAAEDSTDENVI